MATTLCFRDHEEFQRTAMHMLTAGALAGLAFHVAGLLHQGLGPLTAPVPLTAIAGAAAFGATPPRIRLRLRPLAILLVGVAVAAAGLHLLGTRPEPSLGTTVFALAFAALLARGAQGQRWLPGLLAGAAAVLLARFVLDRFAAMAAVPSWIAATAAGAGFGVVAALGILPRHLELRHDRVADAWESCKGKLVGEPKELVARAMAAWSRVDGQLERDSAVRKAIEDAVVRLLEMACRWQAVEAAGNGDAHSADALVARMDEIDRKIARTDDPVARGQYQRAKVALAEQLRYVKEIADSRERVIARMHHYLAAMERLRFAVLNHRSADASRLAAEVQPILEDLHALGVDIDCASEALGEVEQDESSASSPKPTEAKPEAKPGRVAEAKPEAKPGHVAEAKPEAKPGHVAEAKPEAKPGHIADSKPACTVTGTTEPAADAAAETKPTAEKPDTGAEADAAKAGADDEPQFSKPSAEG